MNTIFNINRLGLFLKRFFIENKQRELTFWGITTVVFLLMHLAGSRERSFSVEFYLYISGFIFAARTFKVFNFTPGGMHYLLIPATHLEKLIAAILLSTFYFFIMILITYVLGTTLGTTIGNLFWGTNNPIQFDFFHSVTNFSSLTQPDKTLLNPFLAFASIQSVFMLGSIYFKGNVIGKTILAIIAVSILLGLIEVLLLKVTFGTYSLREQSFNLNITSTDQLFPGIEIMGKIIKYALIPFFWVVSYFRLSEKQV